MFNRIQKMQLKDLFDLFEQDSQRLDVILCRDEYVVGEVQSLLEDDKSITLVTLEQDDLHDQRSILNGLHEVFFEENLSENDEPIDIIEAIEDELGDVESCLLIVEDFSACSIKTQAALLELVIVSRVFKLLLKINDDLVFSENENLWNVLAQRSRLLEDENNFIAEYEANEVDTEDEEDEENNFQNETVFSTEYSETEQELTEPAFTDTDQETQGSSNRKQKQKLAWYQLIPKYHFVAGIFLIVIVFALWNMDINQTKEQDVSLQISNNDSESTPIPETSKSLENGFDSGEISSREISNSEITKPTDTRHENNQPEAVVVLNSEAEKLLETEQAVKQTKIPIKEPEIKIPKPVQAIKTFKQIDWSPYQSDKWIRGLNNKYYTLQLMASHDEQGIRNFLKERGVSSQYAVYTSEKNGKPWHVIIYGVYETHNFADLARKDLPDYLKNYSPWVRSLADVQNTIK